MEACDEAGGGNLTTCILQETAPLPSERVLIAEDLAERLHDLQIAQATGNEGDEGGINASIKPTASPASATGSTDDISHATSGIPLSPSLSEATLMDLCLWSFAATAIESDLNSD